ncbi:MAG: hypothetical protein EOO38_03315 [Cytophagaceae bacterium]|nr:MAG: hypothetical protein EOO38_03315 [Cytophagaceae bacterium]
MHGSNYTGVSNICGLRGIYANTSASSTKIEFTAWDDLGSPNSSLYRGSQEPTALYTYYLGGASKTETTYTANFGQAQINSNFGIYVAADTGTNSNGHINLRNFRVNYIGIAPNSPTELIYSNIVDNGAYPALPTTTDVNTNVSDIGFRGFATPYSASTGIDKIYLSLQRQSDGLYWSGSNWSHLRVNLPATKKLVGPNGRVEWSKIGGLPTGTNLSQGKYTLRTMATEGFTGSSNPEPGTLNTIQFTIDSIAPNPAALTSPSPNLSVSVSSLPSLSGTASDNTGGSGVQNVYVLLTFEGPTVSGGSNPLNWNWTTMTWQPLSVTPIYTKPATITGNGTNWSITSGLPSGSKLYNGYYTVRLYTYDRAGNWTYGAPNFLVSGASPAPSSSNFAASSPSANSS